MDKVKKRFYKGLICRECNTLHNDGIYQKCSTCGLSAASFLVADYDYGLLEKNKFERMINVNDNSIWRYKDLLPVVDEVHTFSSNVYERLGWSDINWALRPFYMEGMKTIAFEISEKFHWCPPDWVIVPTGSGASITAVWKGFMDLKKVGLLKSTPRMVAVQPKGYDPITKAFLKGKTEIIAVNTTVDCLATGARIKNPTRHGQSTLMALQESNGYSISVTNREMITAQHELSTYEGIFPEITSAMALAGAKKMIQKGIVGGDSVLCVISSTGIKETEVLKYHFKRPRRIRPDDFLMSS